jgi:hypothetical protein
VAVRRPILFSVLPPILFPCPEWIYADLISADGFFDAGMLLQALKARGENFDTGETKPSERAAVQARRRDVGKKLRLIDY